MLESTLDNIQQNFFTVYNKMADLSAGNLCPLHMCKPSKVVANKVRIRGVPRLHNNRR